MATEMVPVIGVRLAEGRCGSTLLMQLLATGDGVTFDRRYPAEYRFLSYFARMATMMTEAFDETTHVGVTPFFFGPEPVWGPVPFASEVLDVRRLDAPLLAHMWLAWSDAAKEADPNVRAYAEKLAVDISVLVAAGIPLRVIDLVRDPRDVVASIRSFTSSGIDGFGRTRGMDERDYLRQFVETYRNGLRTMGSPLPEGVERLIVRYEDLVEEPSRETERIGAWLGIDLEHGQVEANRASYEHHFTSSSPEASVGRWRADLASDEAAFISAELGELAGALGYDLGAT